MVLHVQRRATLRVRLRPVVQSLSLALDLCVRPPLPMAYTLELVMDVQERSRCELSHSGRVHIERSWQCLRLQHDGH